LENDRAPLVGLQLGERRETLERVLAALDPIWRLGALAVKPLERAVVATAREQPSARAANGQRLPPGDDAHPSQERRGRKRGRLGQQDQERSLAGVIGVVRAQRDPARDAANRTRVAVEQLRGSQVAVEGDLSLHAEHKLLAVGRAPAILSDPALRCPED